MKILFILDYTTYRENIFDVAKVASLYADAIWFRIKNIDAVDILYLSKRLRNELPSSHLILSERADIAQIAGFNGVHIGSKSIPTYAVKKAFPDLELGYSAHSINEIEEVEADYYTLSPIFYTKKDYEVYPLGPVDVSLAGKKIFALGGISINNVAKLLNRGFYGIAGISFFNDLQELSKKLRNSQ